MISVTILTKNSDQTLKSTLESLKRFQEVLVYDSGSTDSTLEIARLFPNVRIAEGPFRGFGPTHNLASALATHNWVLSIDSDEILSDALVDEILNLQLDPQTVYEINRRNFFNGKWIRAWSPDPVIRLYHRGTTRFSSDAVHEKILSTDLNVQSLSSALLHTPYRSIDDFLSKMQLYSTLFAEQNRGKKSSLTKAVIHGCSAFLRSYILKRGFLGGKEGAIISFYNGHTAFYKYLKLAHAAIN